MCGIAGIWNDSNRPVDERELISLTNRMSHRGPDAIGTYLAEEIGFGHRRLSIIDLELSRQPMVDRFGNVMVYNGELYNYQALRNELQQAGHVFRTQGDTEVVLAAYVQWGPDCLKRLRGMFAIAIWNAKRRELFFARDRFGIKPLCIAQIKDGLAFASEVQAFRGLKGRFQGNCPCERWIAISITATFLHHSRSMKT